MRVRLFFYLKRVFLLLGKGAVPGRQSCITCSAFRLHDLRSEGS